MSDVKKIVTESLIGMISGVTGLVPPDDGSIPDFIQAPIDRAAYRISLLITAKDARIAELERVLHESSQYLDGNKLNQIASGSKLHCMMRGVVSGMHPATPSEDGREVLITRWAHGDAFKDDERGYCYHLQSRESRGPGDVEVMTVAQHSRIVAAKDAEIARLNRLIR